MLKIIFFIRLENFDTFSSRFAKPRGAPSVKSLRSIAVFVRVQPSRYINPTWRLR